MSAETWRRSRTDVAPRYFAWQAWCFLCHRNNRCQRKLGDEVGLMWRRGLLSGRRGTFCATIDHRCQRKFGDEVGLMWRRGLLRGRHGAFGASGSICVAGVVLSVPP